MEVLKYLMMTILPVAALFICKRYASFVDSLVAREEAYLSFLHHIERRVGGYLTPPERLGEGFDDSALSEMLKGLASGMSLAEAYRKFGGEVSVSADEILMELFSDFGKGDVSLEIRRVQEAAEKLSKAIDAAKANGEKQKRVCSAVAPAVIIGIIIWMI